MYIPAVPLTPANARYVEQQKEHFLKGVPPPDFPVAVTGVRLMGLASDEDVEEPLGRKAMGLLTYCCRLVSQYSIAVHKMFCNCCSIQMRVRDNHLTSPHLSFKNYKRLLGCFAVSHPLPLGCEMEL
jgi:hypothetical protein